MQTKCCANPVFFYFRCKCFSQWCRCEMFIWCRCPMQGCRCKVYPWWCQRTYLLLMQMSPYRDGDAKYLVVQMPSNEHVVMQNASCRCIMRCMIVHEWNVRAFFEFFFLFFSFLILTNARCKCHMQMPWLVLPMRYATIVPLYAIDRLLTTDLDVNFLMNAKQNVMQV